MGYCISVTDIKAAENSILRYVKSHYFHQEIKFFALPGPRKHRRISKKNSIYKSWANMLSPTTGSNNIGNTILISYLDW